MYSNLKQCKYARFYSNLINKKGRGTYKNETNSSSLTVISTELALRCEYWLGPQKSQFWVDSPFVVNRLLWPVSSFLKQLQKKPELKSNAIDNTIVFTPSCDIVAVLWRYLVFLLLLILFQLFLLLLLVLLIAACGVPTDSREQQQHK